MTIESRSPRITAEVAGTLAKEILRCKKRDGAFVVGFVGNLGSGKTTFIQGFARALYVKQRLTSPTFLIIRSYKIPTTHYKLLYHVDAYRIKRPNELEILGLEEMFREPKNIVLIEWADKVKKALPKKMIWINFQPGKKPGERRLEFRT